MMKDIRVMIVEMAQTEPRWGYTGIRDRLSNLGHHAGRATVAKILKEHGREPAPPRGRQRSWANFLKTQWAGIAAMDASRMSFLYPTAPGLVIECDQFCQRAATGMW